MIRARILLADDHLAVLKATSALLKAKFEIVGNVADGATLVSEAVRLCPDVVVADITLPIVSGIEAAHLLRQSTPSSKIVFLTVHSEQQFVEACMAEGALGYVLKSHMKAHLIPAIQAALVGKIYICLCSQVMEGRGATLLPASSGRLIPASRTLLRVSATGGALRCNLGRRFFADFVSTRIDEAESQPSALFVGFAKDIFQLLI